ncbi:GSKIP-like protein [Mya arenaria]|uniref:GSKIP-like protein n=1 Tax=Mya arenaria TaxID=6604 RepID=A0ABY7EEH3_MYAAR|nr:GSKIP-like protein [Mya arenaria]
MQFVEPVCISDTYILENNGGEGGEFQTIKQPRWSIFSSLRPDLYSDTYFRPPGDTLIISMEFEVISSPRTQGPRSRSAETKECERYCVELSLNGFRLASRQYDSIDDGSGARYFETIYALLDSISLGYRNTFGDTLIQRLQGLENRKSPSLGEDS